MTSSSFASFEIVYTTIVHNARMTLWCIGYPVLCTCHACVSSRKPNPTSPVDVNSVDHPISDEVQQWVLGCVNCFFRWSSCVINYSKWLRQARPNILIRRRCAAPLSSGHRTWKCWVSPVFQMDWILYLKIKYCFNIELQCYSKQPFFMSLQGLILLQRLFWCCCISME